MKMLLAKVLPRNADREIRLRDFLAPAALGALALGALGVVLRIWFPGHQRHTLSLAAQFEMGLFAWFWLRPILSALVYSAIEHRMVRAYLGMISPRFFATYGAAAALLVDRVLPAHSRALFAHAHRLAPPAITIALVLGGVLAALALRRVFFALTDPARWVAHVAPAFQQADHFALGQSTAPSTGSPVFGASAPAIVDEGYQPLRVPDFSKIP